MKGITACIYKNATLAGCSAGGLSERVDRVTIVGVMDEVAHPRENNGPATPIDPLPHDAQATEPNPAAPPVVLVKRNLGDEIVWHLQPYPAMPGVSEWYTAGGSFAATSDSRLRLVIGPFYGALALHDRKEW